jgi:hypothetical protein
VLGVRNLTGVQSGIDPDHRLPFSSKGAGLSLIDSMDSRKSLGNPPVMLKSREVIFGRNEDQVERIPTEGLPNLDTLDPWARFSQ